MSQRTTRRNPWHILLVVCSGLFLTLLDMSIVNVAQQKIRADLDTGLTEIQWVIDAYMLSFAVLLLALGRIGDLFGRRRVFAGGIALFTTASIACGAAGLTGGAPLLIAARAVQGIGAAAMLAQSLALIAVAFPPERRAAAFGAASAIASLAAVVGPVAGGLIATHFAWEWVFLINLPLGLVLLAAIFRFVPESSDPTAARRLDPIGMVLSGLALLVIVFAIIESAHRGWTDPLVAGLITAGLVIGFVFIRWELRAPYPMIRLELFRIHNFWAGNITMALFNLGFHGTFLPLAVFLQGLLGFSPVEAGLVFVPSAVMMTAVAPIAGRFSDRIGARRLLAAGFAVTAAGQLVLAAQIAPDTSPLGLTAAMLVVGTGVGLLISQINAVPMRDVPAAIVGGASGVLNTTRTAAGMIGIAFLASFLQRSAAANAHAALADAQLSTPIHDRVARLAGEARFADLSSLGSSADQTRIANHLTDLQNAFVGAMQTTLLVASAILLVGVAASLLVRRAGVRDMSSVQETAEYALPAD